jgi:protein gp37
MADRTAIEWTDATWNPVTGCTKVSPGCKNCYAESVSRRFGRSFDVTLHMDRLTEPDHWRKPRRVFVCSMSDLFHRDVSEGFIRDVWDVMRRNPRHQFQVLTKRPARAFRVIEKWHAPALPNVAVGVSVENQARVHERLPDLALTRAALHFVSAEPLLGPVDLRGWLGNAPSVTGCVGWVIVGGESGPQARPMDLEWLIRIVADCKAAGVPVFVKQDSGRFSGRQGNNPNCLWLKEYPNVPRSGA